MKQPSLVYLMEKFALEKSKSDKNNIFVNIEK
jgi:hypothetical protein